MHKAFVVPRLGMLTIEDRLVDYDGPLLFTLRSENGGRFIAFLAFEEEGQTVYWLSSISEKTYRDLLQGVVEVRSAFLKADLLEVRRENFTGRYLEPKWLPKEEIDLDTLPISGFRLQASGTDGALAAGFIETAQVLAMRSGRAVARYVFDTPGSGHEARAQAIAKVILNTQRVVNAIASRNLPVERPAGFIPIRITDKTILHLRPVRQGSLGIELISEYEADMFAESLVGESLSILADVMQDGSDQDLLRQRFATLPKRALKWYRSLITDIAESGLDVAVEMGQPKIDGERQIFFSKSDVPRIVQALNEVYSSEVTELEFNAELIGFDKELRRFHFKSLDDQRDFFGKATGEDAIETGQKAQVSGEYKIRMLEYTEYDAITEAPVTSYELINMVLLRTPS